MALSSWSFLRLFLTGLAAVVLGYIALAAGGMTLAPVLLVAGYCLLIPWALFRLGHSSRSQGETGRGE